MNSSMCFFSLPVYEPLLGAPLISKAKEQIPHFTINPAFSVLDMCDENYQLKFMGENLGGIVLF